MSYILDALKKSERLRRNRSAPVYHHGGRRAGSGRGLLAGALLVVLFLAGGTAVVLYPSGDAEPEQAAVVAPPAPVVAAVAESAPSPEIVAKSPVPVAPLSTGATTRVSGNTSLGRATEVLDADSIPFLSAMSPEFQRDLPPLMVNIHVYSPDRTRCLLYINNRQYQRGEMMDSGVQVMEITPDGVVLQYLGQSFKLPRPS